MGRKSAIVAAILFLMIFSLCSCNNSETNGKSPEGGEEQNNPVNVNAVVEKFKEIYHNAEAITPHRYLVVKDSGNLYTCGIVDEDNNVIIDFNTYEDIGAYTLTGDPEDEKNEIVYMIVTDNMDVCNDYYLLDKNGEPIDGKRWDFLYTIGRAGDGAVIYACLGDKKYSLDEKGNIVYDYQKQGPKHIKSFDNGNLNIVGEECFGIDGGTVLYGLTDKNGNFILETEYFGITVIDKDRILVMKNGYQSIEDSIFDIIDSKGSVISDEEYQRILFYTEDGINYSENGIGINVLGYGYGGEIILAYYIIDRDGRKISGCYRYLDFKDMNTFEASFDSSSEGGFLTDMNGFVIVR